MWIQYWTILYIRLIVVIKFYRKERRGGEKEEGRRRRMKRGWNILENLLYCLNFQLLSNFTIFSIVRYYYTNGQLKLSAIVIIILLSTVVHFNSQIPRSINYKVAYNVVFLCSYLRSYIAYILQSYIVQRSNVYIYQYSRFAPPSFTIITSLRH